MNKYNIGDVVIIRDDLIEDEEYYNEDDTDTWAYFVNDMSTYKGQELEIVDIDHGYYRLDGVKTDTGYWWSWTDAMIAGLATPAYFDADFEAASCDIVSELMG